MGDSLIVSQQFALRSDAWGLLRISRIARPDSLYDASVAARTFWLVNRALGDPSAPDDATGSNIAWGNVDLSESDEKIKFPHIVGFSKFIGKKSFDLNKVNLRKKNKKRIIR